MRNLGVKLVLVAAVLVESSVLSTAAAQCDTVYQWQQWEKAINTGTASLGANPYHDFIIRVSFSSPSWSSSTQDAFWDNDPANPKVFKIRAALPAASPYSSATWNWGSITCTPQTGTPCPPITWSQSSGCITVQPRTTTGVKIWDNGFLKQYALSSGGNIISYSRLFFFNDTAFFWLGDTAWAAPPREIKPQTSQWSTYLPLRRQQNFSVIQIAPAVTWQLNPPLTSLPAASGFSFDQTLSPCTANYPNTLPNSCTRPIKAYWDGFDAMIASANANDLVPLVAGVIDPTDAGGTSVRYPAVQDAKNFARYLAARTAGRAVLFSAGFDDWTTSLTADSQTVQAEMTAVGQAIATAKGNSPVASAPPITNHLAGASACSAYQLFQYPGTWMTFLAYQSGHGKGQGSSEGTVCGGPYPSELPTPSAVTATRRSIQVPSTLLAVGATPSMAGFNAEGAYDTIPTPSPLLPVDNRYRVRQVAYNSALTNAVGFTYGVTDLGLWDKPQTSTFSVPSATQDMAHFRQLINIQVPVLTAFSNWILNQQTAWDTKMSLATDGSTIVLAYLPGYAQNSSIVINTTGLPGLGCGWTSTWVDPVTGVTGAAPCTAGSGRITFNKPLQCGNPDCDWVLQVKKGASAAASTVSSTLGIAAPAGQRIDLRADFSSGDGTSAITATVTAPATPGQGVQPPPATVVVAPPGQSVQDQPQVIAIPNGYLAVWHADRLDGSLLGVFARQIDWRGQFIGHQFQVNLTTEENQRDPVAAADGNGAGVIVWASYGQDGDRGGIFGRLVTAPSPSSLGVVSPVRLGNQEIPINAITVGHQEQPQVIYLTTGSFVVAWQTRADGSNPGAVSARVFDAMGQPISNELAISGESGQSIRIITLAPSSSGGFDLYWGVDDQARQVSELYRQTFDPAGLPVGAPALVSQFGAAP